MKIIEPNHVVLLIGKTYDVESSQPLEIVAKSDARIEVSNVENAGVGKGQTQLID